jgi:hypothetical protein
LVNILSGAVSFGVLALPSLLAFDFLDLGVAFGLGLSSTCWGESDTVTIVPLLDILRWDSEPAVDLGVGGENTFWPCYYGQRFSGALRFA